MSREQIVNKSNTIKAGDYVKLIKLDLDWKHIGNLPNHHKLGGVYEVEDLNYKAGDGSPRVRFKTGYTVPPDWVELVPPQPKVSINDVVEVDLQKANNTCVGIEVVKARPESKTSDFEYKPNLNFLNQQEESNMSNANRRVVNVKLLDNDSGLPVENALVAQFDNIVTEDSNDVVVQEILLNKNIADAIAKHNQKRVEQTDLEILKRTGNDVKLRSVKLKDLTWVVTTA